MSNFLTDAKWDVFEGGHSLCVYLLLVSWLSHHLVRCQNKRYDNHDIFYVALLIHIFWNTCTLKISHFDLLCIIIRHLHSTWEKTCFGFIVCQICDIGK